MTQSQSRPILILGPTAGGKSDLAAAIAESVGGEVIGADSMQVYRHMDAGTAKPPAELRRRVRHYMIDIIEPTERFTVSDWFEQVERIIPDLQGRNIRPVIVGGTNLYIKVLLEGMFTGPEADMSFRESLAELDSQQLYDRLTHIDPDSAGRISPNDRKRVIRALEVYHQTGQAISRFQQQWTEARNEPYRHDPVIIGMDWPVEMINRRINLRVKAMFFPDKVEPDLAASICPNGENLIDETRRLDDQGLLGIQASEALGYKQVLNYLRGRCSLDDAFEQTKILTRRFGKQQRTWLRRFRNVNWLQINDLHDMSHIHDLAMSHVRQYHSGG